MDTATFIMPTPERLQDGTHDEDMEVTFPVKMEVCPRCEGHGSILNPSIGEHAYTMEEFNEEFSDDEDREQYFKRGGIYDVACPECKGANVVPVIDDNNLTGDQKVLYEEYQAYLTEKARWEAEDRNNERWGY